jgi:mRNA-degrading endonuclease RelE of RelBE toxin-antitoxin system
MKYEIRITEYARADFLALDARWRSKVKRALEVHLRHEPTKVSRSRIKRLRGVRKPQYRLRVEEIRVFYDIGNDFVAVHGIAPKSQAEEWLSRYGEQNYD